ncbi:MAG: STAS domain-containing protein [Deltaproteobacteria bacterium]|nr:STAS domain-containing protein [Deltaproteobacteria bacterium]
MAVVSTQSDDGTILNISVIGKFDITSHVSFIQAYRDKLSYYGDKLRLLSRVVVDISKVEYMDSTALGMLLILQEKATVANMADVVLSNCPPCIKETLKNIGADRIVKVDWS